VQRRKGQAKIIGQKRMKKGMGGKGKQKTNKILAYALLA